MFLEIRCIQGLLECECLLLWPYQILGIGLNVFLEQASSTRFSDSRADAVLVDGAKRLSSYFQLYPAVFLWDVELTLLQIRIELTLRLIVSLRRVEPV
jgi:hypothetical protein